MERTVKMRGVEYGFSSDTYDFDYVTTVVSTEGKERRIAGGRLSYWILGLFMRQQYVDFGYGYQNRAAMWQDLNEATKGSKS